MALVKQSLTTRGRCTRGLYISPHPTSLLSSVLCGSQLVDWTSQTGLWPGLSPLISLMVTVPNPAHLAWCCGTVPFLARLLPLPMCGRPQLLDCLPW